MSVRDDAIAAMGGREVEQVNFAVAVQSQEVSRVANIPYPFVGRLTLSITRDVSRQGEDDSFEIRVSERVSLMCLKTSDDYPSWNIRLTWQPRVSGSSPDGRIMGDAPMNQYIRSTLHSD